MGRARHRGAAGPGSAAAGGRAGPGGALTVGRRAAAAALGAALACSQLEPDFDSVIALEIVLPDSGIFAAGDTLHPGARALNGRGEPVPDAEVFWAAIDTAVFQVDETTGATFAAEPGAGRIQARVGNLRSNPVTVIAQAPMDSIRAVGDTADTVTVSGVTRDTLSDSLRIEVFAPAATMTDAQARVRRRITYEMAVFPPGGATVTLVPNDTGFTNTSGIVAVQVRLDAGTLPVSVHVTARAWNRGPTEVPGSPKTFVVEFRQ